MNAPPPGGPRRSVSLRARLTWRITWVILVLVVGFAATTLAAIGAHLYQDARLDARTVASAVSSKTGPAQDALVSAYNRSSDPRIWILKGPEVVARSPNAAPAPPGPHVDGLLWRPIVVYREDASAAGTLVVVDWPLGSDLALLQSLVLVVAAVTLAGIGAGAAIARWTTRRTLVPMKTMTEGVRAMLDTQAIGTLATPSGRDEFSELASLLNRLLQNLDERWQRDREFMADAAHQLLTPLEVIRGNVDIVRGWDDLDSDTRDECLGAVDRTLTDVSRLVRDLLAMEHASGAAKTALQAILLADMAAEVGEDASAVAAADGRVTLSWSADPLLAPVRVLAEPDFARRALWAVVENAIKYTAPGGGVVALQLVRDGAAGRVGIEIRDSGPGIAEEDLPHVFTRFYRGRGARHIPGTGLGLAMAKALMAAQRGAVDIASSASGTVVTLWFQRVEAEAPAAAPAAAAEGA